jgi:hypothetical protein
MDSNLIPPILTGAFALGGSLGGVLVTAHLSRRAERERAAVEDRRRWVAEWRHAYAAYIGIARSMSDQLEAAGNYLPPEAEEDAAKELAERTGKLVAQWHSELQPGLGEVLLIATPEVAELAARVADGLLYVTAALIDPEGHSKFESWNDKCRKMLGALIDTMRSELGVSGVIDSGLIADAALRGDDWPWLPEVSKD